MIGFLSSLHWINSDWDGKIGFRTMRRRKKEQSNGKKTPQPDWSGSKLKSNYSRTRQVHICKNVAIVDRVLAFCSHKFGTEFIDDFHVIGRWWYQARTYDQVVIGDQIEYRRFYFLWKDWLQQLDSFVVKMPHHPSDIQLVMLWFCGSTTDQRVWPAWFFSSHQVESQALSVKDTVQWKGSTSYVAVRRTLTIWESKR